MFAPKLIIVPTDFSTYADQALRYGLDMASKYGAEVALLHVIDEDIRQCAVDYCLTDSAMEEISRQSQKMAKEKIVQQIDRVTGGSKTVTVSSEVRQGIPYDEIGKVQAEKGADLIVMAPHGRSGILRNLIGGVAEKVIRSSRCPVLLVRT
ncbi:MAG: universal stress protein [Smithellaceae bacterium]|nr:universal stress protein [Smithellaceae bacterium]